jgi:proline racemase
MGLLPADHLFTHESIVGTTFRGRVVGREMVGELAAIVPEVQGSAWITGEHTFVIQSDDVLKEGFRLY